MKKLRYKMLWAAAALLALYAVFPAESFAQKRILERQTMQNFIRNFGAITRAFGETANPGERKQVTLGFDELAEKFFELTYTNSDDINGVRNSYQKLLNIKAPSFDKVFSKYGVQPGYRTYIAIFTGITICLFEDEIKKQTRNMLAQFGDGNENVNAAISAKRKILRQLQEMLHSSDLALIEDNKDQLLACFRWE